MLSVYNNTLPPAWRVQPYWATWNSLQSNFNNQTMVFDLWDENHDQLKPDTLENCYKEGVVRVNGDFYVFYANDKAFRLHENFNYRGLYPGQLRRSELIETQNYVMHGMNFLTDVLRRFGVIGNGHLSVNLTRAKFFFVNGIFSIENGISFAEAVDGVTEANNTLNHIFHRCTQQIHHYDIQISSQGFVTEYNMSMCLPEPQRKDLDTTFHGDPSSTVDLVIRHSDYQYGCDCTKNNDLYDDTTYEAFFMRHDIIDVETKRLMVMKMAEKVYAAVSRVYQDLCVVTRPNTTVYAGNLGRY